MSELKSYERELKKGFTFIFQNGDAITRTYDHEEMGGESRTYYISKSTNERREVSPIRLIDDLMIAGQVHKFVPTPNEAKAGQDHARERRIESEARERIHSKANVFQMLEGMDAEEKDSFFAAVKEAQEEKVIEPMEKKVLEPVEKKVIEPEEKKEAMKVCPKCGGPRRGRGYAHKDGCK